jgi:hypothetical protein
MSKMAGSSGSRLLYARIARMRPAVQQDHDEYGLRIGATLLSWAIVRAHSCATAAAVELGVRDG